MFFLTSKGHRFTEEQRRAAALLTRLLALVQQPDPPPLRASRKLIREMFEATFHGIHVGLYPEEPDASISTPEFRDRGANYSKWSIGEIESWRRDTLRVLDNCASFGGNPSEHYWLGQETLGRLHLVVSARPTDAPISIVGPIERIEILQLIGLVRFVGVDRLRRCDCGTVFLRTDKRTQCSPRCYRRVFMRAQRQKEREEQKDFKNGKSPRKK